MQSVHILLTLDCERPNSETHPLASGPRTYESGMKSTEGFLRTAESRGYPVTLFVHPEVVRTDPEAFLGYGSRGHELGLHLHPWRFADHRYRAELGGLGETEARAVISEAVSVWYTALGTRPELFRAGAGSANDATFRILADLGFRGGSTSIPGRVYPDIHAVWAGTNPDPHRANGTFRHVAGALDFVEVPMSVDFSRQVHRNGRTFHWELRPDWDVPYEQVARNILGQVRERDPDVPVITMVTHNDHDFGDPDDPYSGAFIEVIDAIERACEESSVQPLPSTVGEIVDLALQRPIEIAELNPASGKVTQEIGETYEFATPPPLYV